MAVSLPFTFVNCTVIDAGQVNSNFSVLANAVNGGGGGLITALPVTIAQGGTNRTTLPNYGAVPGLSLSGTLLISNGTSLAPMGDAGGVLGGWTGTGAVLTAYHASA